MLCNHHGVLSFRRRGFLTKVRLKPGRQRGGARQALSFQVEGTASALCDLTRPIQVISVIFIFFPPRPFPLVSLINKWTSELFSIPWNKKWFLSAGPAEQQTLVISASGTSLNAGIILDATRKEDSGFLMHLQSPHCHSEIKRGSLLTPTHYSWS